MADAPRPAPRPPSTLRHRLAAAFTERLALKGAALLLAVVLWFVVNVKEPQLEQGPQVELVPVRFTPVLDSTLVLRDAPPPIQALVAGSPEELIKLGTGPLVIHRQISADSPDTLVLDLHPSDVALPEGVDVVVRKISPQSLTLRFESTWTRKVPVRSAIDIAAAPGTAARGAGLGHMSMHFDPDSVEISGPRHRVAQIASVQTVRTSITIPDSLPHLVDIDTTLLGPEIRAKPAQVKVLISPGPRA